MIKTRFVRCGNDIYSAGVMDKSYKMCPDCVEITVEEYERCVRQVHEQEVGRANDMLADALSRISSPIVPLMSGGDDD